ncbi:MAG: hypothetical protein J1F38_03065 [Muribaculaceae bacterium]|nr:hypothetical protein [Muribaculaceae bacterium]
MGLSCYGKYLVRRKIYKHSSSTDYLQMPLGVGGGSNPMPGEIALTLEGVLDFGRFVYG